MLTLSFSVSTDHPQQAEEMTIEQWNTYLNLKALEYDDAGYHMDLSVEPEVKPCGVYTDYM